MNSILKQMETTKQFVHLFEKLRKELGIPLRQPLLDYCYGWSDKKGQEKYGCVSLDHARLIAGSINIWNCGEDYVDRSWYTGWEIEPPSGEKWASLEEDGLFVSLNILIPSWLKEIAEERKKERQEIMQRKSLE